jgi:hypothetical protein
MKVYWEVELYLHAIFTSLIGGKWSDSCFGRFAPDERTFGTHWIGDWVGPNVGLHAVEVEKNFLPLPGTGSRY